MPGGDRTEPRGDGGLDVEIQRLGDGEMGCCWSNENEGVSGLAGSELMSGYHLLAGIVGEDFQSIKQGGRYGGSGFVLLGDLGEQGGQRCLTI